MPRSLITGGAGFLGSHMCDKLIAAGHEVICVDNLLTGSRKNIAHLLDHKNFTFVKHDVTEPLHIEETLDYILHFASPASPKDYLKYPIETMRTGAFGTYNMLELAREKRATFLLASTSEVYGDPEVNPQSEDYWGHVNPIGPRSVYDEAKRYAEALTMAYYRRYGLQVKIVRIFNTYGPRMRLDDGRVLPTFMVQALKGEPLTIYGDGSQTRSFCYIDDLIEGLYLFLVHPGHDPGPLNLGNPEEVSILKLAEEIIQVTNSKSRIIYKALPYDDPKVRRPDISKAQKLLGWEPKVSRIEGLKRSLPYFQSELEEEGALS